MFLKRLMIAVILSATFFSCGGPQKWGVLLWSPDEEKVATGSILPVLSHSKIEKIVVVSLPDKKGKLTLEDFRFELFKTQKLAEKWLNTEYSNPRLFAQVERQGHYIREQAEVQEDNWIYRLREGQIIKIVSKLPDVVKIGSREGYWYDVLTEDGTRGFSFDTYLNVYDAKDGGPTSKDASPEDDIAFSYLSDRRWYPSYFQKMLRENDIDVDMLDPGYGFFMDKDKKTVTILLNHIRSSFAYESVLRLGTRSYLLEPSNIQITVFNEESISILFPNKGKDRAEAFSTFDQEIETKVIAEKNKADAKYASLVNLGPSFSGAGYGTLSLTIYRTFSWTGADNLKGTFIPSYAAESGTVSYNINVNAELSASWDGVLSLYFRGLPDEKAIYFLYKKAENGVTMKALGERYIENNKAVKEDPSAEAFFLSPGGN